MTLLAVDDNADLLDAIGEVLETHGHLVWYARSADEAFERLLREASPPDALLLDLRMPGMAADVFASVVRRSPRWSKVRIVLVTAAPDEELPPDLAVDAVLHKPFPMERLLETVDSLGSSA